MIGSMQFVVVGAGNIGSIYGGNLARIGQHVTLLDIWPEHVAAVEKDGLRISGLSGDFNTTAAFSSMLNGGNGRKSTRMGLWHGRVRFTACMRRPVRRSRC